MRETRRLSETARDETTVDPFHTLDRGGLGSESSRMKPLDFIGAIELAYDRSTDEAAWLGALVEAVGPAFQVGPAPVSGFFFDIRDESAHLSTVASVGEERYTKDHFEQQHAAADGPHRIVYECDMFTLLSRVVGKEMTTRTIEASGMKGEDSLGLRCNMTPDRGIMLTTLVPWGHRIRQRGLWTRFAAHVGSALRLRRMQAAPNPDAAAAILDASGRFEHGNAETVAARQEISSAAKNIDRARGKMRRLDPDAASELWRTMVRGEWSLVDWCDHDGKRFLLAQENRIPAAAPKPLSEREKQVVACAAMGHSNKLIAYDLGLSTGTVSVLLGRAAAKLGVADRVGVIRAYREGAA